MSRRWIGVLLMLLGSLVLGILVGESFHGLFLKLVPRAALTEFVRGQARILHILYGLGAGVFVFLWSLVVLALGRAFAARS